jgi:hypothetical protein
MTSTLCQSAALARIIASWAAKIVEFFTIIVETVLTIAEIVRTALHEFGAWLSWPMTPKLRIMDRHSRLRRQRTGFPFAFGERAPRRCRAAPARITGQPQGRSEQRLMDIEEPEAHDTEASGRHVPT